MAICYINLSSSILFLEFNYHIEEYLFLLFLHISKLAQGSKKVFRLFQINFTALIERSQSYTE